MSTFVLVHGAFIGGYYWKNACRILRAAGHEAYAPTLTGLGERVHLSTPQVGLDTHITDIANLLIYEDLHEVVLLGVSYGGMVITGVAEQIPERISHLVYEDAVVPFNGESMLDLTPPAVRQIVDAGFQAGSDGWRHPGIGEPVSWPSEPHPWKCFTQCLSVTNPTAKLIPRTYIRHTADKGTGEFIELLLAISFERVTAGGWPVRELHEPHYASPESIARLLLELFPAAT